MFTGIVEEIGTVESVTATPAGRRLRVRSRVAVTGTVPGDSVAVNGVCVTVIDCSPPGPGGGEGAFVADVLQRTWDLTNLSSLRHGASINLERALREGDRIGGHLVLGHVDGQGRLESRLREGADLVLVISVPRDLEGGLVPRGSVAVDGVSLTVARLRPGIFHVNIIPLTRRSTTLGRVPTGHAVNIECDIIGKYVNRQRSQDITEEFLREKGFI